MTLRTRLALPAVLGLGLGLGLLFAAPASADEPFTVSVSAPAAKVGVDGVAKVEIKPGAGYHFNKDFPTSLKLTPTAGVTAPAKLGKTDAGVRIEEAGASFDVKLTPTEAGKKTITGQLSFAVCTATTCDPRKAPVTISLDVK